eukprot:Rmarinus@m.15095
MEIIHRLEDSPSDISAHLKKLIEDAIRLIGGQLEKYWEQPHCVAFSFNGGKDCTVVFHLLRAAIATRCQKNGFRYKNVSDFFKQTRIVYFVCEDSFPELEAFIKSTEDEYCIPIQFMREDYISGSRTLVSEGVKVFYMGQRRADPNCQNLEVVSDSSGKYPPFKRINPILDWTYSDVWEFLRQFELPYCKLYDEGYTSLGSVKKTQPNSELSDGHGGYLPAYRLKEETSERTGRC